MPPVVAWAATAIANAIFVEGTTAAAIASAVIQTAAAVEAAPICEPGEGRWTLDATGGDQ